jgi:hypothetical protein
MKSDPLHDHQTRMQTLHADYTRKLQYHQQKAYVDVEELYWLAHDFLAALLNTDKHHTEEELAQKLGAFSHEYITIPQELVRAWHTFLTALSHAQYAGGAMEPNRAQQLRAECARLIQETLAHATHPPDGFTKQVATLRLYIQQNELVKAEELYRRLISEYERLPDEHKHLHYRRFTDAYNAILAARGTATH